jgi:hypothetical protein
MRARAVLFPPGATRPGWSPLVRRQGQSERRTASLKCPSESGPPTLGRWGERHRSSRKYVVCADDLCQVDCVWYLALALRSESSQQSQPQYPVVATVSFDPPPGPPAPALIPPLTPPPPSSCNQCNSARSPGDRFEDCDSSEPFRCPSMNPTAERFAITPISSDSMQSAPGVWMASATSAMARGARGGNNGTGATRSQRLYGVGTCFS